MAETDTRSLAEIKRDTEKSRSGLTETVQELRTAATDTASDLKRRVAPDAIKAEVGDYFRSRGDHLMESVATYGRDNPLQAAAVAATLAYPLLRVAKSIPAPIWMIGAGLFLTGTKAGQDLTSQASDRVGEVADHVGRAQHDLGDAVAGARDYASAKISDAGDAISSALDAVTSTAGSAGAALQQKAGDLATTVTPVRDAMGSSVKTVQDALGDTLSGVPRSPTDAAQAFGSMVAANPLLVGGIGLLIGGIFAKSLPRSDAEDELLGSAGKAIRDAASRGVESAQIAATNLIDDVAQRGADHGLSTDGLERAAKDMVERVSKVADAAKATVGNDPLGRVSKGDQHG
jgi:ElaB/YqjD/DUF883 family membrane-anchored ribosome-binding protein